MILLEDDPLISTCMEQALVDAGFEVLAAARGGEALDLLSKTEDVAALLVDVYLNDPLDGWEVARRARRARPDIAIIYTTAAGPSAYRANAVGRSVLLEKPFTLDHAVSTMRETVGAA